MMRKWHIHNRVLATLIALTCTVLFAVAIAFNLTMRGYIQSRVNAQLTDTSKDAKEERKDFPHGHEDGKKLNGKKDRITGLSGNAVLMDESGELLSVLQGDSTEGQALANYYRDYGIKENETIKIDGSSYAVSVASDPVEEGQLLLVYVDVTSLAELSDQINRILLVIILAAIILSLFLSRWFARSFAGPVQSLTSFAEEIGKGNLSRKEAEFRDLEFDALLESMNHMASDLDQAKKKQDIFFQNVSHELRTPLTSIRGNAEGIVCGVMDPKPAAKIILSESDKLSGLVEDILTLSRMGKSQPEKTAEPIDLREVLSLCVSEQRPEADQKGIVFRFDFDEDPVLVSIRDQDAERLFGNLLSNAIRYAESEVTLACHMDNGEAAVRISDDGPGISEEDLPHVFERFYKGAGGKHGIGLAIAESAAKTANGSLRAGNENGAFFEARFPA